MGHQNEPSKDPDYQPCDRRYRTSKYFLDDQLRCSEAIADFKSVKDFLNTVKENVTATPKLQQAVVRVKTDR